jgi:putative membrane protein
MSPVWCIHKQEKGENMIPDNFFVGAFGALMFGIVGIFMFLGAYFAFDKLTPKLDVPEELCKGNMAVGLVVAALMVSIALVVSSVLR